jgi:hypothetical protein
MLFYVFYNDETLSGNERLSSMKTKQLNSNQNKTSKRTKKPTTKEFEFKDNKQHKINNKHSKQTTALQDTQTITGSLVSKCFFLLASKINASNNVKNQSSFLHMLLATSRNQLQVMQRCLLSGFVICEV